MAAITSTALLTYGASGTNPVTINTTAMTISLNAGVGSLTTAGVTGQCLYSFLKNAWENDSTLIAFPFPMNSITSEQYEFINGWLPANDATRKLIRTAGWAEYGTTGAAITRKYAGIISLGTVGVADQIYHQQSTNASVNLTYQGAANEAVQVYGDTLNGNFDYTTSFKLFVRISGKTYASAQLSDIGVSTMTYQVYRFPLTDSTDSNVQATDTTITTTGPYTAISVSYYSAAQTRTIGASSYSFNIIIQGAGATAEQIYTKVQYLLRQSTTINQAGSSGSVIGNTASSLLSFAGTSLTTATGVYIDGYSNNDVNRITFTDTTGVGRTFPYKASLTINFNTYLQNDPAAMYKVFFTNDNAATTPLGHNFNTANAIVVNDASATPVAMTGTVNGATSVTYTYDYDYNVQRGAGSSGQPAPITVVAVGKTLAQYVTSTGTISRSTSNTVSLVASLERNYQA